jgi:hypothetical protein
MLFMLAARWADDIRTLEKAESRLPWHYVDFPFKPEGEPANIHIMQPPQENILTAIALNERILRSGSDPTKRGIALSWLFHLMGDIHPPFMPYPCSRGTRHIWRGVLPPAERAIEPPQILGLGCSKPSSISTWNTARTAAKR